MRVNRRKYYDDNGKEISEAEWRQKRQEFENKYKRKYEEIVGELVNQINKRCSTSQQKLKMLFDYLTNEEMKYDLRGTCGKRAAQFNYEFPPYNKGWGIPSLTKYAVILNHGGVCDSYSEAFEDICERLGIDCKKVSGDTGMEHSWNVVKEGDVLKHIDVAYALLQRNRENKYNYFMKTFDELQRVAGYRTVNGSLEEIKNELSPIEYIKRRTPGNQTTSIPSNRFKIKRRTPEIQTTSTPNNRFKIKSKTPGNQTTSTTENGFEVKRKTLGSQTDSNTER